MVGLSVHKLERWLKRRHPNKTGKWITSKYWHRIGDDNWVFAVKKGDKPTKLIKHLKTPIARHVKVKGEASPFDIRWKWGILEFKNGNTS